MEADFLAYLKKLEEKKPVIYAGDLNVAHQEIDLKNAKTNRGNAGFTDEERACFSKVLENGFIDTFRDLYRTHRCISGGLYVPGQSKKCRMEN